MHRLIPACLGVLLVGADPPPRPRLAPVYTLRFEETGVAIERPVPADQKPVDLSTEEDKPILTTDVDVIPGQPFRVRTKQGNTIHIVSGKPAAAWNDRGKLPLEFSYAVVEENPGEPPGRTTARTSVALPLGEPLPIGGMITSGVSMRPDGDTQNFRRLVIRVTLLEQTKDEPEK